MSSTEHNDWYEILTVSPSATQEEIKRAWRRQLKFFHPDRFQNDPVMLQEAEQRTKDVNLAYEVLSAPQRRAAYDHSRGYATHPSDPLADWYSRALQCLEQGRWEEAVDVLGNIVALDRRYRDAASLLSEAQIRLEQEAHLNAQYEQAVQYLDREQWQAAIDKLEEILALDAEYRDAATRQSRARQRLETQKQDEQLASLFEQALEHSKAEQWDRTIELLEEIVAADPAYRDVDHLLSEARRQVHDQEQLYQRARSLLDEGSFGQASSLLEQLLRKAPRYKDAPVLLEEARRREKLAELYLEGTHALHRRRWGKAVKLLSQVVALEPDYLDAKVHLTHARKARLMWHRILIAAGLISALVLVAALRAWGIL
jgi:curved DNA-binding protein CbpA